MKRANGKKDQERKRAPVGGPDEPGFVQRNVGKLPSLCRRVIE
jgi:hypothetical protein